MAYRLSILSLAAASMLGLLALETGAFAQQVPPPAQPAAVPPNPSSPPPGYPPPPPGYPPPPPGYPTDQAPPPVIAPGYPPPAYGYPEPPPPPPPKRHDYQFSVRFNPLDLVFGKASIELESMIVNPLSFMIAPEFVYGDVYYSATGIDVSGSGVEMGLGIWLQGKPLRGDYIRFIYEHRSETIVSKDADGTELDRMTIPYNVIGGMFGQESVIAGWFAFSYGIGVGYDLSTEQRSIRCASGIVGTPAECVIDKTGPLHNGWEIISQLAIGAVF